jgi:hypothetical protein
MVSQNQNPNADEKKVYGFPKRCISGVPMADQTTVDGTLIRESDGFAQFRYDDDGTVKQIKPTCLDIFDQRFNSTGGKRRSKSKRRRLRKSSTLKRK